jgi:hypothetical protein
MQGHRGCRQNYGSAWLSYVRKGCCCTARLASVDAASSQSNQRSFRYFGKTGGGEKRSQSLARSPEVPRRSLCLRCCRAAIVFTRRNIRIPQVQVFRLGTQNPSASWKNPDSTLSPDDPCPAGQAENSDMYEKLVKSRPLPFVRCRIFILRNAERLSTR